MSDRTTVVDHSVVCIIDIESFTTNEVPIQASVIENFVDELSLALEGLDDLNPAAWSTGDGAIISIGRQCKISAPSVRRFLDFALQFTYELLSTGVVVRTVINFGHRDRMIALNAKGPLKGEFIQIGHTINNAARLMTFCEPREVLVSGDFMQLLADLDLRTEYTFVANDIVKTKHRQELHTHTFVAPQRWSDQFYSPDTELHKYKKYGSFPAIKSDTLRFFRSRGLEFEIGRVVGSAYSAMGSINNSSTFVSWSSVLRVLAQLVYDPDDRVLVLSRNDHPGFWTQARRAIYLQDLERKARAHGYINQCRVMVYGDDGGHHMNETEHDLHQRLLAIHNSGTFYSFPSSRLFKYGLANSLVFGVTVSTKYRLAIMPIPAPDEEDINHLSPDRFEALLHRYQGYGATDGPMKAVITADPDYVSRLTLELESIIGSTDADSLK